MVQQISRSPEKSNKMYKAAIKSVASPIDPSLEDEVFEKSETQRGTPTKRDKLQVLPLNNRKLSFRRKANLVKNVNIATRRKNSKSALFEKFIFEFIQLSSVRVLDIPH